MGRAVTGFVMVCLLALVPAPATPDLFADLSTDRIAVTIGFTGADVLLFGTTGGEGDVVVVVRGPPKTFSVRRKERLAGIWINRAEATFANAPSFYAVAASRPLEDILTPDLARLHRIGVEKLDLAAAGAGNEQEAASFRSALVRNLQQDQLYSQVTEPIRFLGNNLFRTDVRFPANAPVGAYDVDVFLLRDGGMSLQPMRLYVDKAGFEAQVFDFAHRYALAYGILATVIAVGAGWVASALFRKD